MRRIGLLGGMSWESTAEYYRIINRAVADRLGGLHSADLVMISVDFAPIEAMQSEGRWDDAARELALRARQLRDAGADMILLCTNTMHKVAETIQDAVDIPLLHLADATAAAVVRSGIEQVGLLATAFTMEQDFYRSRLEAAALRVLVPDAEDRADVHRIIYDELCHGIIRRASRERFLEVIQRLEHAGARGVILGCTEIELLIEPERTPETDLPLFPTSRLHALAAVEAALS